jgi:hypothetical protein
LKAPVNTLAFSGVVVANAIESISEPSALKVKAVPLCEDAALHIPEGGDRQF